MMIKNVFYYTAIILTLIFLSGCTTGGSFISTNVTSVELSESNFNIVAKNIQGKSEASYIIGVTYSAGSIANSLAIARVGGSAKLYDDALKNLWKNFESEYGNSEDRDLVLTNIRIDTDMLNLILYAQTELYVTADVIEFHE